MKSMKKVIATGLAAIMMIGTLTGCGKSFDAAEYVTSCLDLITKGETKQYVKTTGRTEEEAQQDYESNIDEMMDAMGDLAISDELSDDYREMYKNLYKNSKYKVTSAEKMKDEDGYTVTIEIEQMTGFFSGVQDALMEQASDYVNSFTDAETVPTEDEMNEAIYQMMLDLLNDKLADITYNDPQTITIEVVGEDGVYSITDEGYQAIDAALLDTSDM